jgi:CheY-like chemotaxis protein
VLYPLSYGGWIDRPVGEFERSARVAAYSSNMESARDPLVLVCDDTASIRRLIRINLELEGCVVEEAPDGREAVRRLIDPDARTPDLVLLDAHMAPHDGWWAIAAIRAHPPLDDVPVVLVSAALHGLDLADVMDLGFDDVLAKPFDPDELIALVSRMTGRTEGVP